jgi:cytoskeleton protein RodZ
VEVDGGLGSTLREARNRRKLDLSEVEAAIKIRVRLLRALENEEWDALPGGSYTRSFIRTYANYLGLDGERLAEEHGSPSRAAPTEGRPRIEPEPIGAGTRGRRLRPPGWALALVVSAALVAIAVAVGVSGGGGGETGPHPGKSRQSSADRAKQRQQRSGVSVSLEATAEVWVCLLDEGGEALVDGQVLEGGAEEGPFHSGSFTVAFGNGEVAMSIDGKEIEIPPSASPLGYSIEGDGRLTPLAEGERPTCL